MAMLPPPTLIITNIGQLVTAADDIHRHPLAQGQLATLADATIAARDGVVIFVGTAMEYANAPFAIDASHPPRIIDAHHQLVTPGLIDAHTHLIYAGDRAHEFQQRHAGIDYATIQAQGGGIATTMRATRAADSETLLQLAQQRLRSMGRHGTTTVEAKSGYGLNDITEAKLLDVAEKIRDVPGLPRVISTFLGAHMVPPEWQDRRSAYVELLVNDWLPRFRPQATFCDVFCEDHAFTVAETATILTRARQLGYRLKLHANQLGNSGGAVLAARYHAVSADHLDYATDDQLDKLAAANVVAVLLPGCSLTLNTPYPDARRFYAHGVRVALATDFNPGTCYCENLQMIVTLAVAHMGMTIENALLAVTRIAAAALDRNDIGSIVVGQRCDLAFWKISRYDQIAYHFGVNLVEYTIRDGNDSMDIIEE